MKEPKFKLDQKVYLAYEERITTRTITAIIKTKEYLYTYFLDYDTSFYYYEYKLNADKDQLKEKLIDNIRTDYFEN
jgi:hypothetical protein